MTFDILPDAPGWRFRAFRRTPVVASLAVGAVIVGATLGVAMVTGGRRGVAPKTVLAAATSTLSASTIVARATSDALAAGSVHLSVTETILANTYTFPGDAGLHSGVQTLNAGAIRYSVRVVGPVTYVDGNSEAMNNVLDLSGSFAGKWIRLVRTDPDYADVTDGVTLPSLLHGLRLTGALTVVRATVNGVPALGVRGLTASTDLPAKTVGTLWVPAAGIPRPLVFTAALPEHGRLTVRFSHWGKPVTVTAPSTWQKYPSTTEASAPTTTALADAGMKTDLRNLATEEETYLTDNLSYATAAQLRPTLTSPLQPGEVVTIHLKGFDGYCFAAHEHPGRFWIYSSEQGGIRGPATADTCSTTMYPQAGGTLTG